MEAELGDNHNSAANNAQEASVEPLPSDLAGRDDGGLGGDGAVVPNGLLSETESDEGQEQDEEGLEFQGGPLNQRRAVKGDDPWTAEEEQELLRLATDEAYRREHLGEQNTKWGPIAEHFQRTIKAVKRKLDKLQASGGDGGRRGRNRKTYQAAYAVVERLQAQHAQQAERPLEHAEQTQQEERALQDQAAALPWGLGSGLGEVLLRPEQARQMAELMQQAQRAQQVRQDLHSGAASTRDQAGSFGEPGQPPDPGQQHREQEEQQQHSLQQQGEALAGQHHPTSLDTLEKGVAAAGLHAPHEEGQQPQEHHQAQGVFDALGPPASELLAGIYIDPSALSGAVPLLSTHQLTSEEAAALQAMQPLQGLQLHSQVLTNGDSEAAAAAAGFAAVLGHAAAGQSMGVGVADAEQQQQALDVVLAAHAAQQQGQQGLPMEQLLHHHNALVAAASAGGDVVGVQGAMPQTLTVASGAVPKKDRQFWSPEEHQQLMRLATDPAHRQAVLGVQELSWDLVAKHLGRGKRSVMRKYDNLRTGMLAAGASAQGVLPSKDGQKWTPEEVAELTRLVEDPAYLKERLGLDKIDWRVLGQHFNRSYETVSYKVSYMKNTQRKSGVGPDGQPLTTGRQHKKARHETSYKDMASQALQLMPNMEGTSGEICTIIANTPAYLPQLDMAIVSGKKTLPRWKHGVRSALNAFNIFERTGATREGEVVWRLNPSAVAAEQMSQAEKAERQRSRPPSATTKRKSRREREEAAVQQAQLRMMDTASERQEEGAQQALAQLAQHAQQGGEERPGRKRKAPAVLLASGEYVEALDDGEEGDDAMDTAQQAAQQAQHVAAQQAHLAAALQDPAAAAAHMAAAAAAGQLHPDALAMMVAQGAVHLDPAVLQAFEHGMHTGPDELASQQQLAQLGYHQGALDSYGVTANGAGGGALLAGVPPELYQHHVAQQFLLFQQQAAAHDPAGPAHHDPSGAGQHLGGGAPGEEESTRAGGATEPLFMPSVTAAGDAAGSQPGAAASYLQQLQQHDVHAAAAAAQHGGLLVPGHHVMLAAQGPGAAAQQGQQEQPMVELSQHHHAAMMQMYLSQQQEAQAPPYHHSSSPDEDHMQALAAVGYQGQQEEPALHHHSGLSQQIMPALAAELAVHMQQAQQQQHQRQGAGETLHDQQQRGLAVWHDQPASGGQ
ncbi:hypothetical protein N2152v2_000351 [Parachlorella kessleri]